MLHGFCNFSPSTNLSATVYRNRRRFISNAMQGVPGWHGNSNAGSMFFASQVQPHIIPATVYFSGFCSWVGNEVIRGNWKRGGKLEQIAIVLVIPDCAHGPYVGLAVQIGPE